jgi:hypothetical protein
MATVPSVHAIAQSDFSHRVELRAVRRTERLARTAREHDACPAADNLAVDTPGVQWLVRGEPREPLP